MFVDTNSAYGYSIIVDYFLFLLLSGVTVVLNVRVVWKWWNEITYTRNELPYFIFSMEKL